MLVDKVKQYMAVSHRSCIIAVALLVVSCGEQAVKNETADAVGEQYCTPDEMGVMPCGCIETIDFDDDIKEEMSQSSVNALIDVAVLADECVTKY